MGSITPVYEIPTHCKAGVIENPGPDFKVKIEMAQVPEPGKPASPNASSV
jgi:hypothetical protein